MKYFFKSFGYDKNNKNFLADLKPNQLTINFSDITMSPWPNAQALCVQKQLLKPVCYRARARKRVQIYPLGISVQEELEAQLLDLETFIRLCCDGFDDSTLARLLTRTAEIEELLMAPNDD